MGQLNIPKSSLVYLDTVTIIYKLLLITAGNIKNSEHNPCRL
jgi:hypothetical protein